MTNTTELELAAAREVLLEMDKIVARLRRENAALVRALQDLLSDADDLDLQRLGQHREASRAALRSAAEKGEPA